MDEHINFRLKATERELRRLKLCNGIILSFLAVCGGLLLFGAAKPDDDVKTITAQRFLLVDKQDTKRAALQCSADSTALLFYDNAGNTKMHLVVDGDPEGGGYLSFLSRNAQSNVRLTMGAKGENSLSLFYKDKQSVWLGSSKETKDTKLGLSNDQISLIVQPDGSAKIRIFDNDKLLFKAP